MIVQEHLAQLCYIVLLVSLLILNETLVSAKNDTFIFEDNCSICCQSYYTEEASPLTSLKLPTCFLDVAKTWKSKVPSTKFVLIDMHLKDFRLFQNLEFGAKSFFRFQKRSSNICLPHCFLFFYARVGLGVINDC